MKVGKQEVFALGKYLRRRYEKLIGNDNYLSNKVYIHSTDCDRTLMSGQLLAAGLFPPAAKQVWNENIKWQPTPIHTVRLHEEQLLALYIPCPRFLYLFRQYTTSTEFKSVIQKYNASIEHWEKQSGKSLQKLDDIMFLYDTLYVEDQKGFV